MQDIAVQSSVTVMLAHTVPLISTVVISGKKFRPLTSTAKLPSMGRPCGVSMALTAAQRQDTRMNPHTAQTKDQ